MKYYLNTLLLAGSLLFACNNNKGKQPAPGEASQSADTTEIGASNQVSRETNELKTLTPLSTEELQAIVPKEVNGIQRDSAMLANAADGVAFCRATYSTSNDKRILLSIWDCAGEAGSGFFGMRYLNQLNFEQADEAGYQKTVELNGMPAIEQYSQKNDVYGLTYFANGRFLVLIEGEKTGLEPVRQAITNISLKSIQ